MRHVHVFQQVRQNGHHQPDAAPTLTHRTAPRQDAREPGRHGDSATRSDECAAPDAAAETEHASSVFHVVRAQFESSDGSGLCASYATSVSPVHSLPTSKQGTAALLCDLRVGSIPVNVPYTVCLCLRMFLQVAACDMRLHCEGFRYCVELLYMYEHRLCIYMYSVPYSIV